MPKAAASHLAGPPRVAQGRPPSHSVSTAARHTQLASPPHIRSPPSAPVERTPSLVPSSNDAQFLIAGRIRPLIGKDIGERAVAAHGPNEIVITHKDTTSVYRFDSVFDHDSTHADVYETAVRPSVRSALRGDTTAVVCYGLSGSGKSYTTTGVIRDAANELFAANTEALPLTFAYDYVEIYKDKMFDLSARAPTSNKHLVLMRKPVDAARVIPIGSAAALLREVAKSDRFRVRRNTTANPTSTRGHALLTVFIKSAGKKVGQITFADLSGHEVPSGDRVCREEGRGINLSLQHLRNSVIAMGRPGADPSWGSYCLTQSLKDAFCGPALPSLIVTLSPCSAHVGQTKCMLKFVEECKGLRVSTAAASAATATGAGTDKQKRVEGSAPVKSTTAAAANRAQLGARPAASAAARAARGAEAPELQSALAETQEKKKKLGKTTAAHGAMCPGHAEPVAVGDGPASSTADLGTGDKAAPPPTDAPECARLVSSPVSAVAGPAAGVGASSVPTAALRWQRCAPLVIVAVAITAAIGAWDSAAAAGNHCPQRVADFAATMFASAQWQRRVGRAAAGAASALPAPANHTP
jgi:hypothetical protein